MNEIIIKTLSSLQKGNDGWIDIATVGAPLLFAGVDYKKEGYKKLRPFLESFDDMLEIRSETDGEKPPVYYVRIKSVELLQSSVNGLKMQSMNNEAPDFALPILHNNQMEEKNPPASNGNFTQKLSRWAFMPPEKVEFLGDKFALPEKWFYGDKPPETGKKHPILWSYLNNTFRKLWIENSICINAEEEYAAFNTGLVDNKYEYIYALFEKNWQNWPEWYLMDFVVAGEDRGKLLKEKFNPLPAKANYFGNNIASVLYDTKTGDLDCDYIHILTERSDRFPKDFYETFCANFAQIDGISISEAYDLDKEAKDEYFKKLGAKIKADKRILRLLVGRIKDAVSLAEKRVEWNYKTAIPMYFPTKNTMSLLLPLTVVDEDRIDLALVVERLSSGSYQGQTVLPLDLAYSNSRLVTRPDSEWLNTESASGLDDLQIE